MDGWMIFAIVEFILLLITWCGIPSIFHTYTKKRRKELEILKLNGSTVDARVRRVKKSKYTILGRKKCVVEALWFDYYSETQHNFENTFWVREDVLLSSPDLHRGDIINVMYCDYPKTITRMERPWR